MNNWVEKLLFALLPVALSGIIYLFHSVMVLQDAVEELKPQAALAREQVRSDLTEKIHDLDKRIAILESRH